MEHRWGERIPVDFPVRVTVLPYSVREGRLNDLSVSGAFIRTNLEPRLLSRVQIAMALPFYPKHEAPLIFAYVARKYPDGIGVEWCEFAPLPVREILRAISVRPHSRLRGPAAPASSTMARMAAPLLKHGT